MDEHNMLRFFNQLIRVVRQNVKNIGIITDKDGTIFLNDNLRETLHNFREKELGANIYIIANSGRTIQDMLNCLEEENIPISYFDYIIGDNGGMCLDVKNNIDLYKHIIDKKVVLDVIQKFLAIGGETSDIRLTDGRNIFAYPSEDVREYYRDAKDIVFRENITDLDEIDITKLTVTASHDKIHELNRFIKDNIKGYETHIGKTSFPNKLRNNYRIDFTGMHTKGKAAKDLKERLGLDTCIYLGNDINDITMFSNALEDNDFIVIANNEYQKITEMLLNQLQEECRLKGIDWNSARLLLLEEENVNSFLRRTSKILAVLNSERKPQTIRQKYKYYVKPVKRIFEMNKDARKREYGNFRR